MKAGQRLVLITSLVAARHAYLPVRLDQNEARDRKVTSMSQVLIWSLSFFGLLFSSPLSKQAEYTFSVRGRAVDPFGHPIKNACIVVSPLPQPVMGDIGFVSKADNEGRFHYSETVRDPSFERLLYVVGPIHEGAVSLISPPFFWMPELRGLQYAGRHILIKPNGVVDVGDVPIQVRYETVNVRIQDQSGAPILVSEDKWEYVWLRIRNLRRGIIYESGLSRDDIRNKVHLSDSMIPIALPEGAWRLEVSTKGHGGRWHSLAIPLKVTSEGRPIEVTLRISGETKRQPKSFHGTLLACQQALK